LWINLPAAEKMKPAEYRDIPADRIPELSFDGGRVRVIAGTLTLVGQTVSGPVSSPEAPLSTDPVYWDLHMEPARLIELPIPAGHNAFVYLYEGQAEVGGQALPHRAAGILGDGDELRIQSGRQGARLLVLAGKPINEPVVQYGPFVMNTRAEIEQAIDDYQHGRLTEPA
jgi:quercetin 2,3-dioxygenase